MRRLRHAASALAACALLSACEDSTGAGPRDALRFTFEGSADGVFEARGAFPGSALGGERSYAVAVDLGEILGEGRIDVVAREHRGDARPDVASLLMGALGEGTYTCTSATVRAGVCPFRIRFAFGDDYTAGYEHTASQLRVLERTESRVRGTFTGTFATFGGRRVTVRDGTFDAAIVPYATFVGGGA